MTIDEIRKERIKRTAMFLNTIAAGCVVAGIIAPMAALFLGLLDAQVTLRNGAVLVCASGPISAGLHWIARRVLRRIRT